MAMLQSSSSYISYGFTYDVFLSFRGIDTRYGFIGNIYKALHEAGIHTFIDDKELHGGDEITPSLVKAIEESRIFIPVFSINYASSSFCLDELVHIIHCFKTKGCLVLPVFYDVEPTHVRHQTESYGEAITKHEKVFQNNKEKYNNNMERLHKWKMALNQAANLSGHYFNPRNGYEYEFIQEIVKYVSNKINRDPLDVVDYPVGLLDRVLKVNSLLEVGSNDEVKMLGIYGPGGMGKSTLARAVSNFIAHQFECVCFLHDVRENSAKHGLEHQQKDFLSKTVGCDIKIGHISEGIPIIRKRLHRKKVLLILDDIDELKQLQALAGGLDWFGVGSRVIVTTRDKNLLASHGIEVTYEIDVLNKEEALELILWKAFKGKQVDLSYAHVLNREDGDMTLHDLIEDMGKEIVRQESKEPEKRSRLWFNEDIFKVLEENSGTSQIEIIHLDFPLAEEIVEWKGDEFKKMKNLKTLIIKTSFFFKPHVHLPNSLRVLEWHKFPLQDIPSDFLPKNLSICKLDYSGLTSFKLANSLKERKFLNMKRLLLNKCEYLTEISDVSSLTNLEEFSFNWCENLLTIHHSIGFLNKLKILDAYGCRRLTSFPPIQLPSLQELDLSFCDRLKNFPEILEKTENLERICMSDTSIEEIPDSFQNLTGLYHILWSSDGMLKLPSSILMMPKLNRIGFYCCNLLPNQGNKPSSIVSSKVKYLKLRECNLTGESLPIVFKWFANVTTLKLSNCNFTILPECIKEHCSLWRLDLNDCKLLQEIRAIPPNLKWLSALNCESLNSSSRSMLLNQELHEVGGTMFRFPGTTLIPNWFEYENKKTSISFWFRNNLPSIALFCTTRRMNKKNGRKAIPFTSPNLIINDYKYTRDYDYIVPFGDTKFKIEPDHTYLFDLQLLDGFQGQFLKNEWNHAKVTYDYEEMDSLLKESRIHIFKQESSMDDIQFINPYKKRKLDDDDDDDDDEEGGGGGGRRRRRRTRRNHF